MDGVILFVYSVLFWVEAHTLWTLVILAGTFLIGLIRESPSIIGISIALAFVSAIIWGYGV